MANNAAPARRAVLGLDVGKASHWACMLTRDGEVAVNRPVANSEHELDRLFSLGDCRRSYRHRAIRQAQEKPPLKNGGFNPRILRATRES